MVDQVRRLVPGEAARYRRAEVHTGRHGRVDDGPPAVALESGRRDVSVLKRLELRTDPLVGQGAAGHGVEHDDLPRERQHMPWQSRRKH